MARAQIFEFHDLSWFPHNWRNFLTEFITCYIRMFNPYGSLAPRMRVLLEKLECRQVVDLCSGASGPVLHMQEMLSKGEKYGVEVTLTDGGLRARFGNQDLGTLEPWEYEIFLTRGPAPQEQRRTLTFVPDGRGNIASLQLFNVTFVRAPRPRATRTP